MDRLQIYQGRTLVGVEFAPAPSSLCSICKNAHVFERISTAEIQKITEGLGRNNTERGFAAQLPQLLAVANERIGYWERKVPPGSKCFVHHARFADEQAAKAGYAEARRKFPSSPCSGSIVSIPRSPCFRTRSRSTQRPTCGGRESRTS